MGSARWRTAGAGLHRAGRRGVLLPADSGRHGRAQRPRLVSPATATRSCPARRSCRVRSASRSRGHHPGRREARPALLDQHNGRWIDFTVVPLADVGTVLDGNTLTLSLTSHAPRAETFDVHVGQIRRCTIAPGHTAVVTVDLGKPAAEATDAITVALRAGSLGQDAADHDPPPPRGHRRDVALRHLEGRLPHAEREGGIEPRKQRRNRHSPASEQRRRGARGPLHAPAVHGWRGRVARAVRAGPAAGRLPLGLPPLVGKEDGSDPGDGILYRLAIREPDGHRTIVAEATVKTHAWVPFEADLVRWAGQPVTLELIADVGKNDDSTGDWACWARPRSRSGRCCTGRWRRGRRRAP